MSSAKQKARFRAWYENNREKVSAYSKAWHKNNPEKVKASNKASREKNCEKIKVRNKAYRENNSEKIKAYYKAFCENNHEERKAYKKAWYDDNSEKVRTQSKAYYENNHEKINVRRKAYLENNPSSKIAERLRSRVRFALKGTPKSASTEKLLGCSFNYFREYFSALFTDDMTITDFMEGRIHIDHRKPCNEFDLTKKEEQKKCFHYTNLQPLWAEENLKKGARYEEVNSY